MLPGSGRLRGRCECGEADVDGAGAGAAADLGEFVFAAANNKLAQVELTLARRAETVSLGMPSYRDTAASVITAVPGPGTCKGTP
jgi:hypothetical protein